MGGVLSCSNQQQPRSRGLVSWLPPQFISPVPDVTYTHFYDERRLLLLATSYYPNYYSYFLGPSCDVSHRSHFAPLFITNDLFRSVAHGCRHADALHPLVSSFSFFFPFRLLKHLHKQISPRATRLIITIILSSRIKYVRYVMFPISLNPHLFNNLLQCCFYYFIIETKRNKVTGE